MPGLCIIILQCIKFIHSFLKEYTMEIRKTSVTEGFLIGDIHGLIKPNNLVMMNSSENSFDSVIVALMDICYHTREQAEQCSVITHYKGKCLVKNGSYTELKQMQEELEDRGIEASIE